MYVLTGLAAVVVVLTRLRLGRSGGAAGRLSMGAGLVNLHTIAGTLALVSWVAFLVAPEDNVVGSSTVGILSLAFRGYRMSEVDALLDRVARELDEASPATATEPAPDPARGDDHTP